MERKTNKKAVLIIVIVALICVGLGVATYFVLWGRKPETEKPKSQSEPETHEETYYEYELEEIEEETETNEEEALYEKLQELEDATSQQEETEETTTAEQPTGGGGVELTEKQQKELDEYLANLEN